MGQNVTNQAGIYFLDKALDAASSVRLMLCNSALWSAEPTEEEVWASEVVEENGYARANVAPVIAATYDATAGRSQRVLQTASITATGGTIEYSGYAIVLDAAGAPANKETTATAANNSFTTVGHGLTNGDRLLITPDDGAVMPTGLDPLTFYYANVVTADRFELSPDATATITVPFTSDGSGTLRLRYCNGVAAFPKRLSTKIIDPAGQAHPFSPIVYLS